MSSGYGRPCSMIEALVNRTISKSKPFIRLLFFRTDGLCLCKNWLRKSAIPLTAGSLLLRVIITLVPLVGLGSDQVSKSTNVGSLIEAYHVDEHRGPDATLLKKRLLSITDVEAEHVSIFLYMSPQSLQPNLF
jgi:hypothetical protein